MSNTNGDGEFLTPPAVGRIFGVNAAKIIAFIKAGLLPAIDVRRPGAKLPRYRISRTAIAEFQERRAAGKSEGHPDG